ncbi:hypothetical protein [Natronosalvus caseinilyticus]|uniref:hypothetical protein n=1 Tax=Natronosalvus caseinilyticus TaxID=2953747 RepID=UPI0028B1A6C4|nr:hypothetical protein [Natronosalvus caseinilyticus]
MREYNANPLKLAGNETQAENGFRRYGRSDAEGIHIDVEFSATPGYGSSGELRADGGDEFEQTVCRCGGCERTFSKDGAIHANAKDGELAQYDTPRCPFCGTEIDNERTQTRTVTWDLEAIDR